VAISLIQHIKAYRPSRLHDTFIISLEETVLGKIYSPTITALSCNDEIFAIKIIDIYSDVNDEEARQVYLKRELKTAASTDNSPHFAPTRLFAFSEMISENIITFDSPVVQVAPDTEYNDTYRLNKLFTGCSEYELNLLIILLEKDNYNEMANSLGTNPETVKYYIRKCFTRVGLKNKTELKALIEKYISVRDLKRYRNTNRGHLKKGR
jgi:DNA-binding CsgD family transcriptional regulator